MRQEKGNSKEVSEKFEKYIDFWNTFDLNVENFFFFKFETIKERERWESSILNLFNKTNSHWLFQII